MYDDDRCVDCDGHVETIRDGRPVCGECADRRDTEESTREPDPAEPARP